jgi:hypothetical protein
MFHITLSSICVLLSSITLAYNNQFDENSCLTDTNNDWDRRILHIITFHSGSEVPRIWHQTSSLIKENNPNIYVSQTGKNIAWGNETFFNKPKNYLAHLQMIMNQKDFEPSTTYAVLLDSDTFWVTKSVKEIWKRFDCIRNNKSIVISTEFSCWMGNFCTSEQVKKYYTTTENGGSVFINSGAVIGLVTELINMLLYMTTNKKQFEVLTIDNKLEYRDQNAMTIYAKLFSQFVTLDTRQYIFANFPILLSLQNINIKSKRKYIGVCKYNIDSNSPISYNCEHYEWLLRSQSGYIFDDHSCQLSRNFSVLLFNKRLYNFVENISPTTLLWHGNGMGKDRFTNFATKMKHCLAKYS